MAVLFVAAMLGHIYIGTIGMEGAFEAMGDGTVDVNWAKQHHSLWLEEEQAKDRPERIGKPAPAPAPPRRRPNKPHNSHGLRDARRSPAGRFCYKRP